MHSKNPRLNVTVEPATALILGKLAKQERKSVSGMAKELILEALERREDQALSELAESRDKGQKKTVKHKDAWK